MLYKEQRNTLKERYSFQAHANFSKDRNNTISDILDLSNQELWKETNTRMTTQGAKFERLIERLRLSESYKCLIRFL